MCFACLRPCEAVWLVCVACGIIIDVMIAILNIRLGVLVVVAHLLVE
jgi:hypothetical protein